MENFNNYNNKDNKERITVKKSEMAEDEVYNKTIEKIISKNSNFEENSFVNCRSVADFEKIEEIGEGTYGTVCII
jgi:hypothetical protein